MVDQSLSNEVEFDVEEGATKAKIKSAFAKNLKSKALNKKVLSQFMDLVCWPVDELSQGGSFGPPNPL